MAYIIPDSKEVISLARPCLYSGSDILEEAAKTLRKLMDKQLDDQISPDELKQLKFLSRLEQVIQRQCMYSLSLQEAADIGLID